MIRIEGGDSGLRHRLLGWLLICDWNIFIFGYGFFYFIKLIIESGEFEKLSDAMVNSRGLGSQTGDMALRELLAHGLISQEDAVFHALDRDTVLNGAAV